jgi:hypothetical protein
VDDYGGLIDGDGTMPAYLFMVTLLVMNGSCYAYDWRWGVSTPLVTFFCGISNMLKQWMLPL